MKFTLPVLSVLLIVLLQSAQAQSKKDLEKYLASATASKDSIQKLFTGLSSKFDSVSKACLVYDKMAKTIKEKVIKYDFNPENMGKILDSLQSNRDSAIAKEKSKFSLLRDSVKIYAHLSDSLQKEIGHLAFEVNKYVGQGTLPATEKDFIGLWTLNTRWFELADDSIQSGIILKPTPAEYNLVSKILFIDFETVQIIFSKGDSIKCFYKVNSFAKDKPFSMDITRDNKVNIRLNLNPMDNQVYVSYKRGKGYLYGFLRKE